MMLVVITNTTLVVLLEAVLGLVVFFLIRGHFFHVVVTIRLPSVQSLHGLLCR